MYSSDRTFNYSNRSYLYSTDQRPHAIFLHEIFVKYTGIQHPTGALDITNRYTGDINIPGNNNIL